MRKVLMLTEYPYDDSEHGLGGIMQSSYQLVEGIKELEQDQVELHVLTQSPKVSKFESRQEGPVHLHFLPKTRSTFAQTFTNPLKLLSFLRNFVKKEKFDVIHGQGAVSYLLLSLLLSKKSVQTIHGLYKNEHASISEKYVSFMEKLKFFLKYKLEAYYLSNIKNLISITDQIEVEIRDHGNTGCNITRINNTVDLAFFRDDLKKKNDRIELTFVAAITPRKGLHTLMDAYRALTLEYDNIHLNVVGTWDWAPDYVKEQMAQADDLIKSDKVVFTGSVSPSDLVSYFYQTDIFVLPSLAESAPMVISQSMCLGIPVVSTRVGGIPQMIDDGETGLLVTPENPDQLKDALRILINDEAKRIAFGQAAQAIGRDRYHPQSVASKTIDVYMNV